jgi:probable HAF family extracellular repeat protein
MSGSATLLSLALIATPALATVRYEIKDLGNLGGVTSEADGVNPTGQIIGLAQIQGGNFHAFLADPGGMRDLGTLGGAQSGARDVNSHGDIVGWANTADGAKHGFYWHAGQMIDLGSLSNGTVDAFSLNDAGTVVGSYINGSFERAFVWSGGVMQDIGTLGGTDSRAIAINNHGDVVGYARPVDEQQIHACLWQGGVARDLGTLGGWASHALGINDQGKVVGWSLMDPETMSHGFEWSDGVMVDLGSIGGRYSSAFAINTSGQVVGTSTDVNNIEHAVLWEGGPIQDLNSMIPPGTGWFLNMASDINDDGVIVGAGTIGGATHAFLLTPVPTLDVPRPAAALAFAGAAPNPGMGGTTLRFSLPTSAHVTLRLFDVRGRAIRTLADRDFGAGQSLVAWDGTADDGSAAGAGIYWARLETSGRSWARRLTLLR